MRSCYCRHCRLQGVPAVFYLESEERRVASLFELKWDATVVLKAVNVLKAIKYAEVPLFGTVVNREELH